MTELSTNFLRGMFAQETGVCPVFLIQITHEELTVPIRISSDPTERLQETVTDLVYGTRSRGEEFIFFPFTLKLPDDEDDGDQRMQLTLDNVLREHIDVLRSISGPPSVTVEIVTSDTPDIVEMLWPDYLLTEATYDASVITGTLELETLVREPYPAMCFTPNLFPNLF